MLTNIILIVVVTIVTLTFVGSIIYVIIEDIKYKKAEGLKEIQKAEYRAKEQANNALISNLRLNHIPLANGFIKCSYEFGRFYIDYEYYYGTKHLSVTRSIRDDGTMWEDYSRLNTEYGFDNGDHATMFDDTIDTLLIELNRRELAEEGILEPNN